MIKKLDHIAIAVQNMDEEIKRYREVLGLEYHGTEPVPGQKVIVALFQIGDIRIELTTPSDDESPLIGFLEKRGNGIHHIAFEVDDLEAELKNFQEKGLDLIHKEPQDGADNAKIAFIHPKSFSGVLVELREKCQK
jgi:methylmalonyl-CoA/ethylmalonyl-CoA epimerase